MGGGTIPLDDPGRFVLLNLSLFLESFSFSPSFSLSGVSGKFGLDDLGLELSSHAKGGADRLRLRSFLNDFLRDTVGLAEEGVDGPCACSGRGSRTNSGRDSIARESFICIWSCTSCGTPSRMNSGRVSIASGSLNFFLGRIASCECSLPASECRARRATNASRCTDIKVPRHRKPYVERKV